MSRRRLDQADFDPYEVDEDGLPLVYNEQRIAAFWKGKPGENYYEQVTLLTSSNLQGMRPSVYYRGTGITLGTICSSLR